MFKRSGKEARAAGDMFYFTGRPCVNEHLSKRYAKSGMCYECLRMHRLRSPEKELARVKRHSERNPESAKARCLRWREKNRHKVNSIEARRRAAKMNATPAWLSEADTKAFDELYERALKVTTETGVKHHVDHVIPLQGERVSGLHVPANLQVIPAFDNLQKHNKFSEAAV